MSEFGHLHVFILLRIFIAFVFAKSLASLAPSSFRFQTCLCTKIATIFFATRVIWFHVIKSERCERLDLDRRDDGWSRSVNGMGWICEL